MSWPWNFTINNLLFFKVVQYLPVEWYATVNILRKTICKFICNYNNLVYWHYLFHETL